MPIKKIAHYFILILTYYLTLILCFFAITSAIGLSYNGNFPLLSNILSLNALVFPFMIAAITMGFTYASTAKNIMRMETALILALLSMLVPCILVVIIFLVSWIARDSIFLDEIGTFSLLLVATNSLLVFFSQLLFSPLICWLCFKTGKYKRLD
jgi:hypothetical protein